jgi:hypothetical protein
MTSSWTFTPVNSAITTNRTFICHGGHKRGDLSIRELTIPVT